MSETRRRRLGSLLRLGLLGKLALSLAAVGLAPLALLPYVLRLDTEAMREQVQRTHALAARTTAARVSAFVGALRDSAQSLALNPVLSSDPRSTAAREMLAGLLQAQPAIAGLALADPEGREVIRAQSRSALGAVAAGLALPPGVAPRVLRHEGQTWLRMDVPLVGGVGALNLVARASQLEEVCRPEELGAEALLVVTDGRDVVVGAAESADLASFPASLVAAGRSGKISGSGRYGGEQGEVLGAYAPVDGTNWFVLSRQPARVAEVVAERVRRRSVLVALAALALAGLLSLLAYRSVVKPIRDLVGAQRRLARGGVWLRSADEITQLQSAFALLERQAEDREAVGQVFLGRYQVLDVLGNGGMGTVFKGWDPKLQRHVALKTVRLAEATPNRGEQVSSLVREAVAVARLNHPNVVSVYDVEDLPEAAFIAMEFVDGVSLARCLSAAGPLPPEQVVPLGAAVARGLAAAHAKGLVHRDVKPANLMLGRDGGIKVTDFGIAELVSAATHGSGMIFGTPGYLSPEALRGEGQDASGDLFALGVILYEALSGDRPFEARDIGDVITLTLERAVPPLPARVQPPEALERLVARLMAKERGQRPSQAAEVAEQLEELATRHHWRWSTSNLPWGAEASDEHPVSGVIPTFSLVMDRHRHFRA